LSLAEREDISRGIASGQSIRAITACIVRVPSTVSREIRRNAGPWQYRANHADNVTWQRAKRPKTCKLKQHPALAREVAEKIAELWAARQNAGWLKRQYPEDESRKVSTLLVAYHLNRPGFRGGCLV